MFANFNMQENFVKKSLVFEKRTCDGVTRIGLREPINKVPIIKVGVWHLMCYFSFLLPTYVYITLNSLLSVIIRHENIYIFNYLRLHIFSIIYRKQNPGKIIMHDAYFNMIMCAKYNIVYYTQVHYRHNCFVMIVFI